MHINVCRLFSYATHVFKSCLVYVRNYLLNQCFLFVCSYGVELSLRVFVTTQQREMRACPGPEIVILMMKNWRERQGGNRGNFNHPESHLDAPDR